MDEPPTIFVINSMEDRHRQEPEEPVIINGIVQPKVFPPPGKVCRVTNQMVFLQKLLKCVWEARESWPFRQPMEELNPTVPDFHTVIPSPMDLCTIKRRLENRYYWSGKECIDDFNTMFTNCFVYGSTSEEFAYMGLSLEEQFNDALKHMLKVEYEIPPEALVPKRKRHKRREHSSSSKRKMSSTHSQGSCRHKHSNAAKQKLVRHDPKSRESQHESADTSLQDGAGHSESRPSTSGVCNSCEKSSHRKDAKRRRKERKDRKKKRKHKEKSHKSSSSSKRSSKKRSKYYRD